jgi:hypothetical protein
MIEPPLAEASIGDLESYPWPDPEDPGRYRDLRERVKLLYETTDHALVAAAIGNGIFEQAQALRGIQHFLEDLLINPVQPRARDMDSAALKNRFGGRVVFHGGVDEQYVLPHGSVEEVREEVHRRIGDFAPGGGYIFAPAHNIQDDVPPENVVAMFEAALEYGYYA